MDFKFWLVADSVKFSANALINNFSLYVLSLLVYWMGLLLVSLVLSPLFFLMFIMMRPFVDTLYVNLVGMPNFVVKTIVTNPAFFLIFVLTILLYSSVLAIIRVGFIRMLLRLYDTGSSSARELIEEFNLVFSCKYVVLTFIYGTCVVLGSLALIIPGLYIASRWCLAHYIFVDRKLGILDALNESWRLTKQFEWPLLIMLLIFYALSSSGIMIALTLFFTDLMFIVAYRTIVSKHAQLATQS